MKIAIVFAFAAFAFLAQADAKSVFEAHSNSIDRGAIADALREKLNAAKKKLDEMLNKAQDALKDTLAEAKNKAEYLIEQLKEKAHLISDKVFVAAQEILDKMDAKINASLPETHTRSRGHIEGISECMIMKDTIHIAAMTLISNVSSCLNEKIDEGESYVVDIYVKTKLALDKIKEIKDESDSCVKDVSGIAQITTAIACIGKASAKGSLVVGQTVPAISLDIAQLIIEISTLQATVPVCMSSNALLTLAQEAEDVVASIKDCIKEKLEGGSKGESEETEEEYTGEQINEGESNNEVVDKHPEVQHQSNFEGESANEHGGLIEIQE